MLQRDHLSRTIDHSPRRINLERLSRAGQLIRVSKAVIDVFIWDLPNSVCHVTNLGLLFRSAI